MTEKLINQKITELSGKIEDESTRPMIPVSIAQQEAADLQDWCMTDKEKLVRAGLKWIYVEEIPVRIGALRVSQAKWSTEYKNYKDCQEEWKIAAPAAYNLRDELVHHFYHALYHNPKEYSKVQRIDEGNTHADMIQDLMDLYELGMKHKKELEYVGVDLSLLEEAKTKSFELTNLLAKVNGSYKDASPLLEIRNRAYAHLKEAVDEIRRIGQYVFWRNEKRLVGYVSPYVKKKNKSRSKKEDQQVSEIKQ